MLTLLLKRCGLHIWRTIGIGKEFQETTDKIFVKKEKVVSGGRNLLASKLISKNITSFGLESRKLRVEFSLSNIRE